MALGTGVTAVHRLSVLSEVVLFRGFGGNRNETEIGWTRGAWRRLAREKPPIDAITDLSVHPTLIRPGGK